MKTILLSIFAVSLFCSSAAAQGSTTPAPCDPANLIPSDVKYGCYNTPDCVTGYMCFYIRVLTDGFYGTTCDEIPMYLCSSPNTPAVYKKEKTNVKVLLARARFNNRKHSS